MSTIYLTFVGSSGQAYKGTVERLADSFFRASSSETFSSGLAYADKAITLTEGTAENLGSYRASVNATTWDDGQYLFRVHESGIPNRSVGGSYFGVIDGAEVQVGEEIPVYHTDIEFNRDQLNGRDEYYVNWYKNGKWINSAIDDHYLIVKDLTTGGDLIPPVALTRVGDTGTYRLNVTTASQRQTVGESYNVIASGTIGGSVRTYPWIVGRDAS